MADSSRTALPLSAVGHIRVALSALIRGDLTSGDVTDALGYVPPRADTTDLGSMTGTLGVAHGGTGATTAGAARSALGAASTAVATAGSDGLMSAADKARLDAPTWGDLAGRSAT